MSRNASRVGSAIGFAVVAIAFLELVALPGTPAVRHDWLFPAESSAFVQRAFDLGLGWSANGLGQPTPYPMTYWAMLPLAIIAKLVNGRVATLLLLAAVPGVAIYVAIKIADRTRLGLHHAVAISAILLFNPWVYNKICAGHVTQTVSLFGTALVLSELFMSVQRRRELTIGVIISTLQTQFFLIVMGACLFKVRVRAVRYALIVGILIFLPSFIGIACDRTTLAHWPFTVAWENDQSVPLRSGTLLLGYFPRYALPAFSGFAGIGNVALALTAVAAAIALRNVRAITAVILAATAILAASGTTGPIGGIWQWSIIHVPVVGVYRELYDLIGVAVAGYIIAAATLASKSRVAAAIMVFVALVDIAAWVVTPPSRLWVKEQNIPPRPAFADMGARYALMPPFQPESYRGRGEGADPLYVGTSPVNVPTNFLWPTYPTDAALAMYGQHGDSKPLAAIGTRTIVCRAGFEESTGARIFYHLTPTHKRCVDQVLNAAPLLSLTSQVHQCSVCSEIGAGNVFFGDAGARVYPIEQQRVYDRAKDGWIDARLIFAQRPDLAQPIGGAYTTQPAKTLAIPGASYLLVNVNGSLLSDDGGVLASNTRGYTWIKNSLRNVKVRCIGHCVVALASDDVPVAPNPRASSRAPVNFSRPLPFVLLLTVSSGSGILRFLETFDPSWTAISTYPAMVLKHQRLDATFNAWTVPEHTEPMRVIIIERTALLQAIASIFGFFVIAFALRDTSRSKGKGVFSEAPESGSDSYLTPV